MNSHDWNLSKEPNTYIPPFGSMKNEILGLPILTLKHDGDASITPPTLQNSRMNSYQSENKRGWAILTFQGIFFEITSTILSMISSVISVLFFLRSLKNFIWSMLNVAWPRPLNSSSILKIQVETYKLWAINLARDIMNSYSS